MTLPAQSLKDLYTGNGVTRDFEYTFKCLDADSLAVYLIDIATGAKTKQVQGTHYSVSGVGTDVGGTVTFVVAPTSQQRVFFTSETPLEQNTAYVEGDKFPAKSHEAALDNLMRIHQENKAATDNAVKAPAEDSATLVLPASAQRALKFLYFDDNGNCAVGDPGEQTSECIQARIDAEAARDAAIAAADNVLIQYYGTTATAGQTTFTPSFSFDHVKQNICVIIGGLVQARDAYTLPDDHTVVLSEALLGGESVVILSTVSSFALPSTPLYPINNLSDLNSVANALTNLGIGALHTANVMVYVNASGSLMPLSLGVAGAVLESGGPASPPVFNRRTKVAADLYLANTCGGV